MGEINVSHELSRNVLPLLPEVSLRKKTKFPKLKNNAHKGLKMKAYVEGRKTCSPLASAQRSH